MKSLWNEEEAAAFKDNPLKLRVYTSRLLGQSRNLVLHGGGNTSVKSDFVDLFGDREEVLYVKGSGWDLATIEDEGFSPVAINALKRMASLDNLSDTEMVRAQRAALKNPYAPNPSVEAILHAIIPFKYVDHTHADPVVTITNTPRGEERIRELYGDRVIVVPYVMPGFILAREIYKMTRDISWDDYQGMVLLHHGVFTFHDDARKSYENMIALVSQAEDYIKENVGALDYTGRSLDEDLLGLSKMRRLVSDYRGTPVIAHLDSSAKSIAYSNLPDVSGISSRGPLTPDHVIRTKPHPVVFNTPIEEALSRFTEDYETYFKRNSSRELTMLDTAPRWGVWPGQGILSFGKNVKEVQIISDISQHTIEAIRNAEVMGGWEVLSEPEIFEMEYWELEQAKLKKAAASPKFEGKIALITGAASGIGRACLKELQQKGAVVVGLDIDSDVENLAGKTALGLQCDVTDNKALSKAVQTVIGEFGGLDIVISNAGSFPQSEKISAMDDMRWEKSMRLNLTSHQQLIKHSIPFLEYGIDPTIIIIASKNVPAPGPGVSAYSVAKAGLTQLARVAALELGEKGIRVNVIHPNAVFDTGIWTPEILEKRAEHYDMSVNEYKCNNVLKTEVSTADVARMAAAMAGRQFGKTTGAQIPVDGGNERVI